MGEKEELNIGLDFGFLSDRISGSIDFYNRETKDLIGDYQVPVPPYFSPWIKANAGSIRNTGLEVSLNIVPVQNKDFTWDSDINFSTNKNKLLSLSSDKYFSDSHQIKETRLPPFSSRLTEYKKENPLETFMVIKLSI